MLTDATQRSTASGAPLEGHDAVAVIGGGIAGLVAARDLARSGARVVLLEAEDDLGGRVRGESIDDVSLDIGAESFATRGGAVAALLAELGMSEDIVNPAPLGSWVVTSDAMRAVPLPPAGTIGIPATPLSWATLRALGVLGACRAAVEPLLPPSVGRMGALDEVIRARLGVRVLDRLVRPVVLGIHSTDPAAMTLRSVPGLAEAYKRRGSLILAARDLRASRTAAGGAVAGLRGGMASLVTRLRDELDQLGVTVRTSTRVVALHRDDTPAPAASGPAAPEGKRTPGLWRISTADTAELHADAVVLAVPEHIAARLLGRPEVTPAEVEVVALLVEDPRLDTATRGTGALVAEVADAPVITAKALTHVTVKWPQRGAERSAGRHVLRLSYGRLGRAPETRELDDRAATARALIDASRILGLELSPSSVRGMRRRVWTNSSISHAETSHPLPPGITLAGDWVSGTGLASVIPGARRAAADTLAALHRSVSGSTPTGEVHPQR